MRARIDPSGSTEWRDFDGTCAMFDGVGSPLTQTFGLGLFGEITGSVLNDIEAFFRDRGADVFHEVCPLSGAALAQWLCSRGYRPVELSNVLYRPLYQLPDVGDLQVARTRDDERDLWVQTTALGWSGIPEAADYSRQAGPGHG